MNALTKPQFPRVKMLLLILMCACATPLPTEKVLRPVRVEIPKTSTCSSASRFSGTIEPFSQVEVAFKRGGYISDILRVQGEEGRRIVEEGDRVRRGTVLARLRNADYRVKLEQAEAQLAEVRTARDQARQDHDRAIELLKGNVISQSLFESAEAKAFTAEAQVQAATALVDEAALAVDDCVLRAPMDGMIWKRFIEVGSLVGPGTPGFVLADTTSMKIVFGVPDVLLNSVPVNAMLEVSVDAIHAPPVQGKVARVAPEADPKSRLFDMEILLPNADGQFRAGMIASLKTPEKAPRRALAVPLSAVVRPPRSTEGFAVFVADGDILRVRRIDPGELCEGLIEVTSGLGPNDRVVTEGAKQAYDGERAAVNP